MKWIQKPEQQEKWNKPWHKWFAWHPVVLLEYDSSGNKVMVWLETVLRVGYKRRDDYGDYHWDYFYKRIK